MYNTEVLSAFVTSIKMDDFSSQANSDVKSFYSFLWASIWGVKLR